jgi:ABC-type branched-subunit amino acid transport system ATPase component
VSCGPLRDLDLALHAGERVAVMAAAGGGERALAEVLVGVRQPERGRIRRAGRDVTVPRTERGAQRTPPAVGVAWLSTTPRLFGHLTVYENVLVTAMAARRRRRISEAHARRALERTGLLAQADVLPGGLDAADRVRLDAARAIAAPRDLVVVEAGAAIQAATVDLLEDVLEDAVEQGAALVWLDQARLVPNHVERLVVLGHGRILADATPDEITGSGILGGWRPPARRAAPARSASSTTASSTTQAAAPSSAPSSPGAAATGTARAAPSTVFEIAAWRVPPPPSAPLARLDLALDGEEIVGLVGEDGAAIELVLRSLAGLAEAEGRLWLRGRDLTGASAAERARAGVAFVPREGALVERLTVAEHLRLAGMRRRRRRWTSSSLYALFPSLALVSDRRAAELPVLERRCLALARALATNPRVLLVDQPLQGLTARLYASLLEALALVGRETPVLLGEIYAGPALPIAGRVVALDADRIPRPVGAS